MENEFRVEGHNRGTTVFVSHVFEIVKLMLFENLCGHLLKG